MSITPIDAWRLDGCGPACFPRSHDPIAHEAYGFARGRQETVQRIVRTGPLVVDLDARSVTVDGAEVRLSGREWGVLAYLAERVGRWCKMTDIVRDVWGPEYVRAMPYGQGTTRGDHHMLRILLGRLRVKLGPAARLLSSGRSGWPRRRLDLEPAS